MKGAEPSAQWKWVALKGGGSHHDTSDGHCSVTTRQQQRPERSNTANVQQQQLTRRDPTHPTATTAVTSHHVHHTHTNTHTSPSPITVRHPPSLALTDPHPFPHTQTHTHTHTPSNKRAMTSRRQQSLHGARSNALHSCLRGTYGYFVIRHRILDTGACNACLRVRKRSRGTGVPLKNSQQKYHLLRKLKCGCKSSSSGRNSCCS